MITFSLGIFNASAQLTIQNGGDILTFKKSGDFKEANVSGSRFFEEKFVNAKVNDGNSLFPIRYNAYADVMEYKKGNEILELTKEENKKIEFSNNDKFQLLTYTINEKEVSRYHQIIFSDKDIIISKFRSIKFTPAKPAANTYDTAIQANFKPNNDKYFITTNNETIEFDGKSKSLEKAFPNKATQIKQFFKDNKVKENDADLIKIGNLLIK